MNTTRQLRILYIAILLCAAGIAVVYESNLVAAGSFFQHTPWHHAFEMVGILQALAFIPLALKLLTLKGIRQRIRQSERHYQRWAELRLALLATPLIFNLAQYYWLAYDTTCGYLALMTAAAFLFVWPSDERMESERHTMDED